MIELRNLTLPLSHDYHPQKQQALSLFLESGKHYWLVGPPESGKTSLLDILALQRHFTSGSLTMFGFEISPNLAPKTLSLLRSRTGYVADQPEFIEDWTLFDNIALPMRLNHYNRKTILRDTMSILKWLGLDDMAHNFPGTLSHTGRLKLAVARALIIRPALLLIDKMALSINPALRDKLVILLKDMIASGRTIIVTAADKRDIIPTLPAPLITLPALGGIHNSPEPPSSAKDPLSSFSQGR